MKKIILILTLMFALCSFSSKYVHYGHSVKCAKCVEEAKEWPGHYICIAERTLEPYKTEDGKEIVFHSSMGAVNWFVSNGWKLESTHMSTCNDRTIKMYVVSKEIPVEQAKAKQQKYVKK
jgi:hypothetical protein